MLYMGNVNRIIFWFLIPLVLVLFLVFRVSIWWLWDDGGRQDIVEQHAINLTNRNDIDCLILGGSNAVFSLSAEQLSKEKGLNCYNLSLLNEGYSFSSYWDAVKSMPIDVSNIRYVFYSSVVPYRLDSYLVEKQENERAGLTISGNQEFSLIGRSLASYLKDGQSIVNFPLPTEYGDFDFSKFNHCREDVEGNDRIIKDMESLSNWADTQLTTIFSIFSNAQLYFILPSELKGKNFDITSQKNLIKILQSISLNFDNTSIIVQPSFENSLQLCDASHHANNKGRSWRTIDLIARLKASVD